MILAEKSILAERICQMIDLVEFEIMERICFAISDNQLENDILRTNRPEPTPYFQKKQIEDMNKSDQEWIDELARYKTAIDVKQYEQIPLSEYELSWYNYILNQTDTKPEGNKTAEFKLKHIESERPATELIPF